jgi:hypothetical protein
MAFFWFSSAFNFRTITKKAELTHTYSRNFYIYYINIAYVVNEILTVV